MGSSKKSKRSRTRQNEPKIDTDYIFSNYNLIIKYHEFPQHVPAFERTRTKRLLLSHSHFQRKIDWFLHLLHCGYYPFNFRIHDSNLIFWFLFKFSNRQPGKIRGSVLFRKHHCPFRVHCILILGLAFLSGSSVNLKIWSTNKEESRVWYFSGLCLALLFQRWYSTAGC